METTIQAIEENFFKGSQSINFTGTYILGKNKIRITISQTNHEPQSFAKVSVWKDLEWSFIELIPPTQMEVVKANVFYGSEITQAIKSVFQKDIDNLKQKAINILI